MRDFDYAAPTTLAEALAVLAAHDGRARPLAGGTDLIDHVRTGRLAPDVIVDVKRIPELNVLEFSERGLRLGAAHLLNQNPHARRILGQRCEGRENH